MLNDAVVVQSAVSAFNNAALWAPAFLWWAGLALPLFVVVWWCGGAIMQRVGWTDDNILGRVSIWTAGLTLVWLVLMGGNYGVLRDSLSVLPMMIAAIVFLTSLFVSSHMRTRPLPHMNWWRWIVLLGVLVIVGLSDLHAWWGPLLQIGAIALGAVLGRVAKAEMRPISGTLLIALTTTVAILMQPEFFRFGQLGNLTVFHLGAILLLGMAAMGTIAVLNINARGAVRRGVFIKLKWLMRVSCALGAALFLLTEAVPVFIGTLVAMFVSFAMSVWHSDKFDARLGYMMFACALGLFGVITVMPVITVMGILDWQSVKGCNFWRNVKQLL